LALTLDTDIQSIEEQLIGDDRVSKRRPFFIVEDICLLKLGKQT